MLWRAVAEFYPRVPVIKDNMFEHLQPQTCSHFPRLQRMLRDRYVALEETNSSRKFKNEAQQHLNHIQINLARMAMCWQWRHGGVAGRPGYITRCVHYRIRQTWTRVSENRDAKNRPRGEPGTVPTVPPRAQRLASGSRGLYMYSCLCICICTYTWGGWAGRLASGPPSPSSEHSASACQPVETSIPWLHKSFRYKLAGR